MRAIVKGFLVGTLGLAVLLGSPALTLAKPKIITAGKTYCMCRCYSEQATPKDVFWERDKACSSSEGKACRIRWGNNWYSGKLVGCWECVGDTDGGCSAPGRMYQPPADAQQIVAPELAPPSTTIPPYGPRPAPGGIQGR